VAGGRQHPIIAEAALEFLPDEAAAVCRDEHDAYRLGSLWPDAMGSRFSCKGVGGYVLPDGRLDTARVRSAFDDAGNGVASSDEMESWGLFSSLAWVISHGVASPDFYARELRSSLKCGETRRAAFIAGFLTHITEYAAHYKSQEAMVSTVRPEGRVPVGFHKGQPFYSIEVATGLPGFDDPEAGSTTFEERTAVFARTGREALEDCSETAEACQRRLVAEGVGSLFGCALALQHAIVSCDGPGEIAHLAPEFRGLVARGLARSFEYCRAACSEALGDAPAPPAPPAPPVPPAPAEAELLFLVRGDLWLRHPLDGPAAQAVPGVARLRFAAALERLGVSYRFCAGDNPDAVASAPLIISLEGWSSDAGAEADGAVYDRLRAAALSGSAVLLVGEPHASRAETAAWSELCDCEHVTRCVEVAGMVTWIERALGPGRIDAELAAPPAEVISTLEEIRQSPLERQMRLNDDAFLRAAFTTGDAKEADR